MTKQKSGSNYGIQVNHGGLQARNVAVGENAVAYSENKSQVFGPISELKDLLSSAGLPLSEKLIAETAVAEIELEGRKTEPAKGNVQSALERLAQLGATSTALFPLVDRMTPLLQRIGQSLAG